VSTKKGKDEAENLKYSPRRCSIAQLPAPEAPLVTLRMKASTVIRREKDVLENSPWASRGTGENADSREKKGGREELQEEQEHGRTHALDDDIAKSDFWPKKRRGPWASGGKFDGR